jgi:hypothetical protein
MSQSVLQKVLRSGEHTIHSLSELLGIKCRRHPQLPFLIQFTYDQIESPQLDPIVQAARGCILNEIDNWSYVARPFERFFNHNQGHASKITYPAKFTKKEDGSLVIMYYYALRWHFATKGSPDASGKVGQHDFVFADLIQRTAKELNYNFNGFSLNLRYTYVWELCTPYNVVVCPQTKPRLVLLAVIDNETGEELDVETFRVNGWEIVQQYEINNLEEALQSFNDLPALENEGYVVLSAPSGKIDRIKVKHPGYLALTHLKSSLTPKNMLELVRTEDPGEFLATFPEYTPLYEEVKVKYEALIATLEKLWEDTRNIESQKDFALALKASGVPYATVLFTVRREHITVRNALCGVQLDKLYSYL